MNMHIFPFLFVSIAEGMAKLQILPENGLQSTLSLGQCLLVASKTYFSTLTYILPYDGVNQTLELVPLNYIFLSLLGMNQSITFFVRYSNDHNPKDMTSTRERNYIIQMRDLKDFEDSIQKLKKASELNAKTKLMVVSLVTLQKPRSIAESIMKILQENDVLNEAIILPSLENPKNFSIYVRESITNTTHCDEEFQVILIDSCASGIFTSHERWFRDGAKKRTGGCRIRANYLNWAPYAVNEKPGYQHSDHLINQGLEINLLNMLASLLDFQIVYSKSKTWGNILENGSTTEGFTLLENKSVDILIGAYTITYTRSIYIETSVSYLRENLMWCVPHEPVREGMEFGEPKVWVMIVFAYVCLIIPLWLVSRRNHIELSCYKCLTNTVISSFAVILGISLEGLPRTRKSRYFMALLIFFGYYTNILYTSILTSEVMSPRFEEKYISMKDIYEHNLTTYFAINTLRYFEGEVVNGVPKSLIRSRAIDCPNIIECLKSVASGKSAYLCPRLPSTYIKNRVIHEDNIHCFIYSSIGVPIAMMMRKGFPMQDSFDGLILRILSSGFLVKWEKDIMFSPKKNEIMNTGVRMDNLRDIIQMLVLGYLISCGVFVIEVHFGRK